MTRLSARAVSPESSSRTWGELISGARRRRTSKPRNLTAIDMVRTGFAVVHSSVVSWNRFEDAVDPEFFRDIWQVAKRKDMITLFK